MIYDLIIIGGGPGGVAAGVYAARKRLKTVLVAKEIGGQSNVSEDIQNWIGTISIKGLALADNFRQHLKAYAGDTVDIKEGGYVNSIKKTSDGFMVKTSEGDFEGKTVLLTAGSTRRKLIVPGAVEFENKGITYCASCDGPLFSDQDVVVIGGGNAAFETAAQLLAYCKSVTLLNRSEEFRADPVTVKKVLSNPKMHAVLNADLVEVKGEKFVKSIVYQNRETKENTELSVTGVFVEIGLIPSTDFTKGLVAQNTYGQIIVDPRTQQTSSPGIWAAGDCTDGLYHQNNIAAGDAVKALEDIYVHLHTK